MKFISHASKYIKIYILNFTINWLSTQKKIFFFSPSFLKLKQRKANVRRKASPWNRRIALSTSTSVSDRKVEVHKIDRPNNNNKNKNLFKTINYFPFCKLFFELVFETKTSFTKFITKIWMKWNVFSSIAFTILFTFYTLF